MAEQDYMEMLKQSLEKKISILDQLQVKNREQTQMLSDPNVTPDDLDHNIAQKASLIEQIVNLDAGFEQMYQRIKGVLETDRARYRDDIALMQSMIQQIVDKSTDVQVQEQKNKELATQKFATVKQQVKEIRQSQKAVNSYYQNMMKVNYVDPQFMDSKK